jgi:photosystem II stability/assembly factor-like uncharacterized protein
MLILPTNKNCGGTKLKSVRITILVAPIYISCFLSLAIAQGNWEQMLPPGPTSNQMVALYFVDENTGWSVGEHGTILKTTDGGESWRLIQIPWMTYLLDIFFVNDSIGYSVGQDGLIIKSLDGGESWVQLENQYINNLNRIIFKDENTGWAIGEKGLILFTNDGGENWVQQLSNVGEDLFGICFIGESDICIAGDNFTILKSTIDTDSWQLINFEPGPFDQNSTYDFYDIYFLNDFHGWICGKKRQSSGTILYTLNGGNLWEEKDIKFTQYQDYSARSRSSNGISNSLQQILFLDDQNGFLLTHPDDEMGITSNIPYFTSNGGKNWNCNMYGSFENSEHKGRLFNISNNKIINTGFQGEFRFAENNLDQWKFPNESARNFTNFYIGNNGVLFGTRYKVGAEFPKAERVFSRSTDYGESWVDFLPLYYDSTGNQFEPDKSLNFVSLKNCENILWAFDYDLVEKIASFYESKDLGLTWRFLQKATHVFTHILAQDTLFSYYLEQIEEQPEVYHSQITITNSLDCGITTNTYYISDIWNEIVTSEQSLIYDNRFISDSYFFNGTTGFLIGSEGNIIKTENTGENWRAINSGVTEHLWDIEFINHSVGFIVGDFGRILKTENGGENWYKTDSGTQENIYSIAFLNELEGWAGTESGLLYTTDGGETWQGVPLRYHHGFVRFIEFDINGNGYAYSCAINQPYGLRQRFWRRPAGYSYLLSWKNNISEVAYTINDLVIPQSIILNQNYPNPFNNSTKICYQLSKSNIVKLNIFNLQGQLVRELVNESQKAGDHSVYWDGRSISGEEVTSGVYIYSIESDHKIHVKKMLYLR